LITPNLTHLRIVAVAGRVPPQNGTASRLVGGGQVDLIRPSNTPPRTQERAS